MPPPAPSRLPKPAASREPVLPALNPRPRLGRAPPPPPGGGSVGSPAFPRMVLLPRVRNQPRLPGPGVGGAGRCPRSAPAAAPLPPQQAPDPGVLPRSDPSGPYLWRPLTHAACPPTPTHARTHADNSPDPPAEPQSPGQPRPVAARQSSRTLAKSLALSLCDPGSAAPSFGPWGRPCPTALPGMRVPGKGAGRAPGR